MLLMTDWGQVLCTVYSGVHTAGNLCTLFTVFLRLVQTGPSLVNVLHFQCDIKLTEVKQVLIDKATFFTDRDLFSMLVIFV